MNWKSTLQTGEAICWLRLPIEYFPIIKIMRDSKIIKNKKSAIALSLLLMSINFSVFAGQLRTPLIKPVILKSNSLVVTIDRATGLPYKYDYKGSVIWGADSLKAIPVILCRLKPREYINLNAMAASVNATATQAEPPVASMGSITMISKRSRLGGRLWW